MSVESVILKSIQENDYELIAQQEPANEDVLLSKIVALIRLERYQEALELSNNHLLEKAYCLYRLNDLETCLDLIQSETMVPFQLLKAQVLIRLDRFEESIQIYEQLEQDEDVQTNILAAQSQLLVQPTIQPTTSSGLFNLACYYANNQQFQLADQTLQKAMDICREENEMKDVDIELANMVAVRGYIQQCQGLKSQSILSYHSVLNSGTTDPVLIGLVYHNLKSSKAQKILQDEQVQAKLTLKQKEMIQCNEFIIQKSGDFKDLETRYPQSDRIRFLEIGMALKSKSKQVALQEAKAFVTKYPDSIAAQAHLLQHHLENANFHEMESQIYLLLENEQFNEHQPGLISLLTWIYERNGKHQQAYDLLQSRSGNTRSERLQLAQCKLRLGRYTEALTDFEWLVEDDNTDTNAVAGYVLCLSHTDPYKASEMLGALKQNIVSENIDVDELETLKKVVEKKESEAKPKKRKKKPLPKNYNPDVQPDPERWIPKHLRSGFKSKKTKSNAQGVALEGGGIGSTGSAKIAGATPVQPQVAETKTEPKMAKKKKGKK